MDLKSLYKILEETTAEFRKGPKIEERQAGPIKVTEIWAKPPASDAGSDVEKVDVEFMVIGVNRAAAEKRRSDLVAILDSYPRPDRLANGPSYIEVGAEIGNQGAAFRLFALGKVLGLWDLITPTKLGFEGEEARALAGNGFVMITGYRPASAVTTLSPSRHDGGGAMIDRETWHPWVRPMSKRRKRCFANMKRWRNQYLSRLWNGYGKHKARGLRIWLSARYPDARRLR